jgi:hypothetical protein
VHEDADAPSFGSWVHVEADDGTTLYGLVSHVETGPAAANRQPRALGLSEEERRKEMPHVRKLLRTTYRAQVLGYRTADGRQVRQTLPPRPAAIHAFAEPCPPEAVRALGRPYDFLRTLAHHPDEAVPADDLLVAVLGQIHAAQETEDEARAELVAAGRQLSRLLDDDHERLHAILRRVEA